MAKTLKAVAPESPVRPSFTDPRFIPHEFQTIEEMFEKRHGWIAPSKRQHLKARAAGEKVRFVGRIGIKDEFIPEEE